MAACGETVQELKEMRVALGTTPSCYDYDEMARLHALAAGGDRGARDTFVLAHMPLALRVAYRYAHGSWGGRVGVEDVAQTAVIGLFAAMGHYTVERSRSFPAYATAWMISKGQGLAALTSQNLSVPRHIFTKATATMKKQETPGDDAVGVAVALIKGEKAMGQAKGGYALDSYIDTSTESPYEEVEREDEREFAHKLLTRLEHVDQDVVKRRFGIAPYDEPQSRKVIAAAHSKTRHWVDTRLAMAVEQMRHPKD